MKKLAESGVISLAIGVLFSLLLALYACDKEEQIRPTASSVNEPGGIALKESCKAKCSGGSCKCSGDNTASCSCKGGVPSCHCTTIEIDIENGKEYFLKFIAVVSEFKSREAAKVAADLRMLKVAMERKNEVQYKKVMNEFEPDMMKMSANEKAAVNQFFVEQGVNYTL